MLERVASLKQEMQDLRVANARLDEPRWRTQSYETRLSRLEEIKAELAEMLYEFKRTGTDFCSVEGCYPKGTIRFSVTINAIDFVCIWLGRALVCCGG